MNIRRQTKRNLGIGLLLLASFGCGDDVYPNQARAPEPKPEPKPETDAGLPVGFSQVVKAPAAAMLSVHGTSQSDVWVSGADDGQGALVAHFDGQQWQKLMPGFRGDLWWVNAVSEQDAWFGGTDATILHYRQGNFERLRTPGLGKHTVYGIWVAAENDVYAVGSAAGRNGFVWHYDGTRFEDVPLPVTLPEDESHDQPGLFKVWGKDPQDVWVVGGRGVVLHGSASAGFELVRSGKDETLFTVNTQGAHVVAVGGGSAGAILEGNDGEVKDVAPEGTPPLQAVAIAPDDSVWAAGYGGAVYHGVKGDYTAIDTGLDLPPSHSLHAAWVDPKGGVWLVGGDVLTPKLDSGVLLYAGRDNVTPWEVAVPVAAPVVCPEAAIDPTPGASIARRWNEQILGAIRRDLPRPTVHARNLFHLSVALWDAYAAFDSSLVSYLGSESSIATEPSARDEAMSYAAFRVLSHRYRTAVGGATSQACLEAFMQRLGYDPKTTSLEGDAPSALGNRIGAQVITTFAGDGANEAADYADPEKFEPANPYCVVDRPGTHLEHPAQWQKLVLAKAETQNGISASAGAQSYIGAQWRSVTPFGLLRVEPQQPYVDLGHPFLALNAELTKQVVEIIQRSAQLDPADETQIDISPAAVGNNPLASNEGQGYSTNPLLGEAYAPNLVRRSDFGRTLAEFWADGPNSETPPGHWNVLANKASDSSRKHQLFGRGVELTGLDWDVRLYLALNGALHDAAIAAWELKRVYVTARPISLVRYLAGLGQSSDPGAPSYHAGGLPLIAGLIELITSETSAPGQRHAHLARYVGELAVKAWLGEPGDRKKEVGGVGFVRAADWMPYQRRTFVTPAFPGYVSGHSSFSRAAAEVLTQLTGSAYFPDGFASFSANPGYLVFEQGPRDPVKLQWATYYDAADQAGQSRVWGGIHIQSDDFDGRLTGDRVGRLAIERALAYISLD